MGELAKDRKSLKEKLAGLDEDDRAAMLEELGGNGDTKDLRKTVVELQKAVDDLVKKGPSKEKRGFFDW